MLLPPSVTTLNALESDIPYTWSNFSVSRLMRYAVSDGQHTVHASLTFTASKPFVKLVSGRAFLPSAASKDAGSEFLLITFREISATTNIDVDLENIGFQIHPGAGSSPFRVLSKTGQLVQSSSFQQRDINQNRVFLALQAFGSITGLSSQPTMTIPIRIVASTISSSVGNFSQDAISDQMVYADVAITVERLLPDSRNRPKVLVLRLKSEGLSVPMSSSVSITEELLDVVMEEDGTDISDIKFVLADKPNQGTLLLQSSKEPSTAFQSNNNNFVWGFRRKELLSGQLQYIHSGALHNTSSIGNAEGGVDSFSVNVSVAWSSSADGKYKSDESMLSIGSLRVPIRAIDNTQILLIVPSSLSIASSAPNLVLTPRHLRVSVPAEMDINPDELEYRLVQKPQSGSLVNRRSGQPIISAFNQNQLFNAEVVYLKSPTATGAPEEEWMVLRACSTGARQAKCSTPTKLKIKLEMDNQMGPEVVHNEILSIPTTPPVNSKPRSGIITQKHLKAVDPDTPTNELKYLVWQPIGGRLAWLDQPLQDVHSFTQADLENDTSQLVFIPNQNGSTLSNSGFSFLVTDGLHQSRPEWFTVERVRVRKTVVLEANARLNAAPGIASVISVDMLRANISNVEPEDILFRVTRLPQHGRLLLEKVQRPVDEFTQADINTRRLTYQPQSDLGGWSQRDHFNFVVVAAAKTHSSEEQVRQHQKDEEFRFRIITSYSNVPTSSLHKFVNTMPIVVKGLGGSVAINASHLNLTKLSTLCDDALFVEVYRSPRHGRLVKLSEQLATPPTPSNSREETEPDEDVASRQPEDEEGTSSVEMSAEELHSGRQLVYRHIPTQELEQDEEDEFTFSVYSLREKHRKGVSLLRIPLSVSLVNMKQPNGEQWGKLVNWPKPIFRFLY
uniref:Uncharacterized protein n=1 Tax=Ditylenchus dipsaci TaxID=166011 RepID=A0A915DXC8_9BILA